MFGGERDEAEDSGWCGRGCWWRVFRKNNVRLIGFLIGGEEICCSNRR